MSSMTRVTNLVARKRKYASEVTASDPQQNEGNETSASAKPYANGSQKAKSSHSIGAKARSTGYRGGTAFLSLK